MKTIGIDTNVLLTFRLERKPHFPKVKRLFERCLQGKVNIYVPTPVILEMEWVLRSFYKEPKERIILFFEDLFLMKGIVLDHKEDLKFSLNTYKNTSAVSFTDCIIVRQMQVKDAEFLTFDKSLEKLYHSS